jgi:N-acetylglutamate synthase-like GNAT family acetyltransferase
MNSRAISRWLCVERTPDMTVRMATPSDIATVCDIHVEAFPGFFLTMLGKGFLAEYYATVMAAPKGICLVALDEASTPVGFVAGFVDNAGFYSLLRARKVTLALRAARHLVTHPWQLLRMVKTAARVSSAADTDQDTSSMAELSSIGVRPSVGGRGYGKDLVVAFVQRAYDLAATSVFLTTDAVENEEVNTFYVRLGFTLGPQYTAPGRRQMNKYTLQLDPNTPWSPPERRGDSSS